MAAIDIDSARQVEGDSAKRLFEPVPQGQVRSVDIEAAVDAIAGADGFADPIAVLVDGGCGRGGVGAGRLPGKVRPEDKRVEAVDLVFEIELDALICRS